MTGHTLGVTVELPYDDAVGATRAVLADAGFGVLTEIDVRATLKAKLDVDVPDEIILGACRPELAHRAMSADPSVATLLPCNVVVRAVAPGRTVVETVDPVTMLGVTGRDELADVADEARRRLTEALSRLTAGTAPLRG